MPLERKAFTTFVPMNFTTKQYNPPQRNDMLILELLSLTLLKIEVSSLQSLLCSQTAILK